MYYCQPQQMFYQQQQEQSNYYQQQQSQMNYFQPQQSFYYPSLFQQAPQVHQQQQKLTNCQQVPSFQKLPNLTSTPEVSITKRGRPLGSKSSSTKKN
jgi:hypothetical protein